MRAYTRAGEDKDYKDKYAHVTLAEEEYKPEEIVTEAELQARLLVLLLL